MFVRRAVKSARSATAAADDDLIEVIVDDDGAVYTTEGVFMGNAIDMVGQLTSEGPSHLPSNTAEGSPVAANVATSTLQHSQTSTPIRADMSAAVEDASVLDMDESFAVGFIPQACVSMVTSSEPQFDDQLNFASPADAEPAGARRRRPVLLVAASVALLASTAAPKGIARLLIVLGVASLGAAFTPKVEVVTIQPALLSSRADYNAETLSSRNGAAIDTGASMHVSGRKELFPPHLIVDHHPLIRVQIANDVKCAVEYKGAMRIRTCEV